MDSTDIVRLPLILPIALLCGAAVLVSAATPTVTFTDATAAAGLTFVHMGAARGTTRPRGGDPCLLIGLDPPPGWQPQDRSKEALQGPLAPAPGQ